MRRLPRRLIWRVVVLFVLGGLQGFVGWWMVKSGLEARVTVAPERLATHLGLALLLYAALIWTGLEAWAGPRRQGEGRDTPLGLVAAVMAVMAYLQCLLGALVAGNQAGLVDNDWPLMNGRFFPDDYWLGGLAHTLLHSRAAVQFNHRVMAYALFAMALATALTALGVQRLPGAVKALAGLLALLITAQACLGIMTLVHLAPLPLSLAHQAGAAIVLGVSVAFAWRARRAGGL
jgi:cytochrome c oxidase assembly protein subunit 15